MAFSGTADANVNAGAKSLIGFVPGELGMGPELLLYPQREALSRVSHPGSNPRSLGRLLHWGGLQLKQLHPQQQRS